MGKSMHPVAIRRRKEQNSRRPCLATGCSKHREGLSGYCSLHAVRNDLYGHYNGKRLLRKTYHFEHAEVVAFLARYKTHPGIVSALEILSTWLRDASAGLQVPAHAEFQRLSAAGVSAQDILTEALATWLYIHRNPSTFPSNRSVDSAIGTSVLYLSPRSQREIWTNGVRTTTAEKISGGKRRTTGEFIRKGMGSLFLNIERQIIADHEEQARRAQSMTLPFTPSPERGE